MACDIHADVLPAETSVDEMIDGHDPVATAQIKGAYVSSSHARRGLAQRPIEERAHRQAGWARHRRDGHGGAGEVLDLDARFAGRVRISFVSPSVEREVLPPLRARGGRAFPKPI